MIAGFSFRGGKTYVYRRVYIWLPQKVYLLRHKIHNYLYVFNVPTQLTTF